MARPRGCSYENTEPDGAAENGSGSQPLHPEVRTGCSIVLTAKSRPKEGGFPFG
jgi:hypothetical protein